MNESNEDELTPLMASYHRCRDDDRFVDTFYELFLGKSPAIAQMFVHTDFKHQKLMLRESLLEMLCYDNGMAGAEAEVLKLSARHKTLGVKPEMFAMWLDSLCEAVEKHDPQYTPAIGTLWRNAMQKGIDLMLSS
ncbi:MAG: globin [Pirellulaceae bacterium]|nr:globin [Pirellulaceae bacterium]